MADLDVDPTLEPRNLQSLLSVRLTAISRKFAIGGTRIFAARFGLNHRELRVLLLLRSHKQLTSTDIADMGLMEKATVSRALKSLRARGLVEARASDVDLRSSTVCLTSEGTVQANACFSASRQRMQSVLSVMSIEERRTLSELLSRVEARLDELNADQVVSADQSNELFADH
jgi:DNA-binding MarR family transcriptional regulator